MRHAQITWAGAIGVLAAMPLAAAPPRNDTSKVLDTLLACRTIPDPAARVACYDSAAAAFQTARERKEVVVLDRAGVKEVKKSAFGFSGAQIRLFGGGSDEPEVTELKAVLTRVQEGQYGLFVYTLDNGSVWQTTEEQTFGPKSGQPITIRAGLLGSYIAKVGKNSEVRVKRIR